MVYRVKNLPNTWKKVKVKEVAKVNKSTISAIGCPENIEYIDISSVAEREMLSPEPMPFSNAPSRAKRIVSNGDTLISTVRPNLRHFTYLKEVGQNWVASTGFAVVSPENGVDSRFLYYYLTSDSFVDYLSAVADGAAYPAFNPKEIEEAELAYPPLPEQKAIADFLGALDDKIELNIKMNETLEQMAQAIFKSWFIDFDPVKVKAQGKKPKLPLPLGEGKGEGLDTETATLWPDFFEDSPLGKIPKGWGIERIGQVLKTVLGGTPSRAIKDYWQGDISWINSGKINEFRIIEPSEQITEEALSKSATKLLPKRTTVLAITGATLGQVSLLEIESCSNQSVVGIIASEEIRSEYIYWWIKLNIDRLISNQTGGAQQHINKGNVDDLLILVPSSEILDGYYLQVTAIFERIKNNCFETKTLAESRDLLLPKLLSGEIQI